MTKIVVLKEQRANELRVAATAETVKKFISLGVEVEIESGAGETSEVSNNDYETAGAKISADRDALLASANIIIGVQPDLSVAEIKKLKSGTSVVGQFNPYSNVSNIERFAENNISAFAMEFIPRITRAQTMDVLSSQSNIAGYKAVLDAFNISKKVIPMMMTAAGTIKPAKVLVLGAGVAGLQAIATAKRMGAVVSAFDVRPAVKEQVESLGAKFIEVESEEAQKSETTGGYAKEMSEEYKRKQAELIHQVAKEQDIIITTALIPGRPAPVLIPEAIVKDMKAGSIIVDLAVSAGGNCPLSELNEVVVKHGVTIIGYENFPSRVPLDASALYSRNIFNFVSTLIDKETKALIINQEDEIIKGCLLTKDGKVVNKALLDFMGKQTGERKPATESMPPKETSLDKPHLKNKIKDKNKEGAAND